MGIKDGGRPKNKNFSSSVLNIELEGPTRSHFGILDVPGIFHALTNGVTEEEKKQVKKMVISHMKKPENIIMHVHNFFSLRYLADIHQMCGLSPC